MSKLTDLLDRYVEKRMTRQELVTELVGFTFSPLPARERFKYDTPEHVREAEEYWGGWPHENTAEEITQYRSAGKLTPDDMRAITSALLG